MKLDLKHLCSLYYQMSNAINYIFIPQLSYNLTWPFEQSLDQSLFKKKIEGLIETATTLAMRSSYEIKIWYI